MEKERPPVFGMSERGGQVVINLLANVQQKTIEPSPWTGVSSHEMTMATACVKCM